MSDYTPTTDEVSAYYVTAKHTLNPETPTEQSRADFQRWLASHDAEVAERIAKAIENDCEADEPPCYGCWNAARIAREAGKQ